MVLPPRLPNLPLTCLATADCHQMASVEFRGERITVIDFWTTKCTRCPSALDNLNRMAIDVRFRDTVRFTSICCDSCDGAREILEKDDYPRWSNVHHYFMDGESKELAKRILGFKTVPFYVIVNEQGDIIRKGSSKQVDLELLLPALVHADDESKENKRQYLPENKVASISAPLALAPVQVERQFIIDEDF